jgi:NAD(P)-dependent dehydrogenase (short-subunit alcohol dehydrogenase family)
MSSLSLREQDLQGKVAVITGASRGIGRAIAMKLAARGCSILGTCSSTQNISLIDSMNQDIDNLYENSKSHRASKIIGIAADILLPTCAQTIAGALVQHFDGRVDIFVNNAADSHPGTIGELTTDEIQESLVSNIQTPVLIVDELVKRKMFQPDSRIIYISSVRSRQPWSMQLMYAAGKSAGESLCRTWAQAFGGREEKVSSPEFLHRFPVVAEGVISYSCPFVFCILVIGRKSVRLHGRHYRQCRDSWSDTNGLSHAMSTRSPRDFQE